jgi:hypothetical protein
LCACGPLFSARAGGGLAPRLSAAMGGIKKQILHCVQEILRLSSPNLHPTDHPEGSRLSVGTPVRNVWGPFQPPQRQGGRALGIAGGHGLPDERGRFRVVVSHPSAERLRKNGAPGFSFKPADFFYARSTITIDTSLNGGTWKLT